MKYFKTYKLFEETSKPGAFDNNSWDLNKGMFGPLFLSLIRGISFQSKKIEIGKFIDKLDDILNDNYIFYKKYLKDKTTITEIDDSDTGKLDSVDMSIIKDIEESPKTDIEKIKKDIDFSVEPKEEEPKEEEPKEDIIEPTVKQQEVKQPNNLKIKKDYFNYDNSDIDNIINKYKNEYSIPIINKLKVKITQLKNETLKRLDTLYDDYIDFDSGEVYDNFEEVQNIINTKQDFLKNRIDKLDQFDLLLTDKLKNLSQYKAGFKIKKMNESSALRPEKWTEQDRLNVTNSLNAYAIENVFKNKKSFIDAIKNSKEKEKLEKLFETKFDKLLQKWFYIYDVDNIKNKDFVNKQIKSKNSVNTLNKVTENEISDPKIGNYQLLTVLKKQFLQDKSDFYSSPFFDGLEKSKDTYFLFNIGGNNVFLIKKLFFEDSKYAFKLIGKLSYERNNLKIEHSYNSVEKFNLGSDNMDLFLLKDELYSFPLIFFEQNNMYSINHFHKITKPLNLVLFNIIALNINFVREFIINDININLDKISVKIDKDIKKIILEK